MKVGDLVRRKKKHTETKEISGDVGVVIALSWSPKHSIATVVWSSRSKSFHHWMSRLEVIA